MMTLKKLYQMLHTKVEALKVSIFEEKEQGPVFSAWNLFQVLALSAVSFAKMLVENLIVLFGDPSHSFAVVTETAKDASYSLDRHVAYRTKARAYTFGTLMSAVAVVTIFTLVSSVIMPALYPANARTTSKTWSSAQDFLNNAATTGMPATLNNVEVGGGALATASFSETFAATTYKDVANTTATWDTSGQLSGAPLAPTVMTLQPDATAGKDAFVRINDDWGPNSANYGSEISLEFRHQSSSYDRNVFIEFTGLPTTLVSAATLSLYLYDNWFGSADHVDRTYEIKKVTTSWNEEAVSASNQPSINATVRASAVVSQTYLTGWVDWDITALVNEWITSPSTNYGMAIDVLESGTWNASRFYSSDHTTASLRPKLAMEVASAAEPVAHWKFDEGSGTSVDDLSTNNNTGTLSGSPLPTWGAGHSGQALTFDGVGNYIAVASVPTTVTNNWTMVAWINPANLSQYSIAVSNGFDNGVVGDGYAFGINNGNGSGPGDKLSGLLPGVAFIDTGYTFTQADQWYHVVMLRDNGTIKFYVNGTQTPGTSSIVPIAPTEFRIGSQHGTRFFAGGIDEVAVYDRVLSIEEIGQSYSGTTPSSGSSIARSLTVDSVDANITSATLTKSDTAGTGTIDYLLSNDGGATWATVSADVPYSFASSGSDLRFKILLSGDATVADIGIAYSYFTGGGDGEVWLSQYATHSFFETFENSNFMEANYSSAEWSGGTLGAVPNTVTGWHGLASTSVAYDTLSSPPDISYGRSSPQAVVGSDSAPQVIWIDKANSSYGQVFYSRWNGSAWTGLASTSAQHDVLSLPSSYDYPYIKRLPFKWKPLVLDSQNRPYIVWGQGTKLYFIRWDGSAWSGMDGVPGQQEFATLANSYNSDQQNIRVYLTPSGVPYIFYGNRYFTHWDGTQWVKMDGTAGSDDVASLVAGFYDDYSAQFLLDSAGRPCVLSTARPGGGYRNDPWNDLTLYFTHWDGTQWVKMNGTAGVDAVSPGGVRAPVLKLSSSDVPYVIWQAATTQQMGFSRWNGSAWSGLLNTTAGSYDPIPVPVGYGNEYVANNHNLFLDNNNNPHIITGDDDLYYIYWNGVKWTKRSQSSSMLFSSGLSNRGKLGPSAYKNGEGSSNGNYTPEQIGVPENITALEAGQDHSLALKSDGTVWAWGGNDFGELGVGTSGSGITLMPRRINTLSGITAIDTFATHSLALKSDGTVWAWGGNSYGQLGNGTTGGISNVPVQVSGLTSVATIAAGISHSLAIKSDGTVWAWGRNNYGQLGDGTTTDSNVPVQVSGLSGAVGVAAGEFHSLAAKSDGTIWAWGRNNYGQLGDGTTTDSAIPVFVPNSLTELFTVTQQPGPSDGKDAYVESNWYPGSNFGNSGAITLSKYSPSYFDKNIYIQFQNLPTAPVSTASLKLYLDPVQYQTWPAVTDEIRKVTSAWEEGTVTWYAQPTVDATVRASVSVGAGTSGWITYDVTALVNEWIASPSTNFGMQLTLQAGYYYYDHPYRSSDYVADPLSRPKLTTLTVGNGSRAVQVAAGKNFSLALLSDKRVASWGYNQYGQLGNTNVGGYSQVPGLVSGITEVEYVSAGHDHALAVLSSGLVNGWGNDAYSGVLGSGTQLASPVSTPIQMSTVVNAVSASGGAKHTLVVSSPNTDETDKIGLTSKLLGYYESYIIFDASNNPHIFFTFANSATGGYSDIGAVTWDGTQWVGDSSGTPWRETIGVTGYSNQYQDIAAIIDPLNKISIAAIGGYSSYPNVHFFRLYAPSSAFTGTSKVIDTVPDGIGWATLTKNDSPGDALITYYLSNNDGANWSQVTPGQRFNFATTGSDLRFKIVSLGDANATVSDLTVEYGGYNNEGTLSNLTIDALALTQWGRLTWDATLNGQTLRFRTRGANDSAGLLGGTWSRYYTSSDVAIDSSDSRWLEVEVSFSSDGRATPVLRSFSIDYVTNQAPDVRSATIVSTDPNTGVVTLSYEVRDEDTNTGSFTPGSVNISLEYWNGSQWIPATSVTGNGPVDVSTTSPSEYSGPYTMTWEPRIDFAGQYLADAKLRVVANDSESAHNIGYGETPPFTLDTKDPLVTYVELKGNEGVISIQASDDSAFSVILSGNADLSPDGLNSNSGQWLPYQASIPWDYGTGRTTTVYYQFRDISGNITQAGSRITLEQPEHPYVYDISNFNTNEWRTFVTWDVVGDTATGGVTFKRYNVYRSTDGGATWSLITAQASLDRMTNYYYDKYLDSSIRYQYRVASEDSLNNVSKLSVNALGFGRGGPETVEGTIPNGQGGRDVTPPTISNVLVASVTDNTAVITWDKEEISD